VRRCPLCRPPYFLLYVVFATRALVCRRLINSLAGSPVNDGPSAAAFAGDYRGHVLVAHFVLLAISAAAVDTAGDSRCFDAAVRELANSVIQATPELDRCDLVGGHFQRKIASARQNVANSAKIPKATTAKLRSVAGLTGSWGSPICCRPQLHHRLLAPRCEQ
jgi:hypothetical protein